MKEELSPTEGSDSEEMGLFEKHIPKKRVRAK
jgi:hypothetical protein